MINIENTDFYKIGITKKKVEKRIKQLQTGSPFKINFIESFESELYKTIETVMHRRFQNKKYIEHDFTYLDGEWFLFSKEDICEFRKECEKIEDSIKCIQENSSFL
ncbi:MAG: GIY-YIG nuclease family protein [Candidatus Izemoplasmatales bacterium]